MNLKDTGNYIYLIGATRNELGGSVYSKIKKIKGGFVPELDIKISKRIMKKVHTAVTKSIVESCHDCSEGGFVTAVSEMAFAGEKGVKINADLIKTGDNKMTLAEILFSESNTRFIIEVKPENSSDFEKIFEGEIFSQIGMVSDDKFLTLTSEKSNISIKENIKNLQKAWQETLQW